MVAPKKPGSFAKRLSRLEHMLTALFNSLADEAGGNDLSFEHLMVAPKSPGSFATRLSRLEHILTALFNSLGDEAGDKDLSFEFGLSPQRSQGNERSQHELQLDSLERQLEKWQRERTFSILPQLEELRSEVNKLQLKGIGRPQAEGDHIQASAIARLVGALDKVPNAAIQAGSVLVVKLTTPNGPVIQARTLTQEEMVALENNQLLLQDPAKVLGRLSAACTSSRGLPPPNRLQ